MSKPFNSNALICPSCATNNFSISDSKLKCNVCLNNFDFLNDVYYFKAFNHDQVTDNFDKIKYFLKNNSKIYDLLIKILSPVYPSLRIQKFIKTHIKTTGVVAINLGSGNSNISDKVSNIDIFPYKNVNIVCDIEHIPIANNSVDIIFITGVLEHVTSPEKVISEIYRILKPEGIVYSFMPFIQPFHASPNDFSRRTYEGIKVLFNKFETIELSSAGGPTSGMLWIVQEWLTLVLSLGIKQLHTIIYLIIMLFTFPLKYLDIILMKLPMSKNISSGFLYIGKKIHIL